MRLLIKFFILFLLCILLVGAIVFARQSPAKLVTTADTYAERLLLPDGSQYTGALERGVLAGQGELMWANGDSYKGNFSAGVLAGQGALKLNSGDEYRGEFVAGELTGQGEFIGAGGVRYEGQFLRDKFNGKGEYFDSEGGRYLGHFTEGSLTGPGEYFGPDGEHYEGEFKDWLYEGAGTFTEKNGVYKGQFANGYYDGYGQYLYSDESDSPGKLVAGKWSWGEYEDEEESAGLKNLMVRVEKAIYQQEQLLKTALTRILKSDPQKINLYFVGVASYSRQDVFRKEVEFIRQEFDDHFATEGRSLVLINSDKTLETIPLASTYSIEKSLQAVAEKMNPEKDILFVYLTSHGSAKHELSMVQQGLSLPDLTAERLGEIVKSLPAKWKVIAISACYSGGYIPFIKSPDTLVMTASSKSRRSFGCSDTSEMTYFGRAYFKEALAKSRSFEEAFSRSKILIEQWEKETDKDVQHSQPQISMGKTIQHYLPKWWQHIPPRAHETQKKSRE